VISNEGIRPYVYPRKGVIHVFQMPFIVYEHWEKRNPKGELLMVDLKNSLSPKSMNSHRSDYNKCTNLPFVYQLTLKKYHEPIED
jgi:hypothetical protein